MRLAPGDAQFMMGDWRLTHGLSNRVICGEENVQIICDCGWRVTSTPSIAKRLAKTHIERARERGAEIKGE